jgi:hypothetical protein
MQGYDREREHRIVTHPERAHIDGTADVIENRYLTTRDTMAIGINMPRLKSRLKANEADAASVKI